MPSFLSAWVPHAAPVSVKERIRSAVGALLGILATGLASRWAVGSVGALPILIAPMGASAVLLFAVPSSPLAQPWSILGGNTIAATVGVSAAMAIPDPFMAASVAVGISIGLMMSCRCVHPPSGAVALTAVLGGPAVKNLGYGFVIWPVGANSLLLLGAALLFNNLAGRCYPHRPLAVPVVPASRSPEPAAQLGFTRADLDAVLAETDQLIDVDPDDLESILRQVELRPFRRRSGETTCGAVMSRDVVAIAPGAPIRAALDQLRAHRVKLLPVTDESARVLGVVSQTDLLDKAAWSSRGPCLDLHRRLWRSVARGRAARGSVADIMTAPAVTVAPDAPLADVVRLMARTGLHHLPVAGTDAKLAGIVSQSDLIVALLAETGRQG